jgi:hypothetical protein
MKPEHFRRQFVCDTCSHYNFKTDRCESRRDGFSLEGHSHESVCDNYVGEGKSEAAPPKKKP